ncbi:MAG: carboxypeptidase regulatory-like domain-containing protein [Pedobacter sp.]|nr:MAG: carboxypeptidase regulatory-like domain-containing protein [Pedobacter sp.]
MKKVILSFLALFAIAFCLLAFDAFRAGGIRGRITPLDGADKVIAVSGKDSLISNITNGSFSFGNVKPSTYTILVHAKPPFKDISIPNVPVIDSTITDVGDIKLVQ